MKDLRAIRLSAVLMLLCALFSSASIAGVNKEAKTAYDRGDFDTCIKMLASELRKKPDHQDNIALMGTAIPLAFEKHKRSAERAVDAQEWDTAVIEYRAIDELSGTLADLPPVPKKIEGKKEKEQVSFSMQDVSKELRAAKEKAIEMHYSKAREAETEGKFKTAAVEYRLTREYDSSYSDAAERYAACREKAILKIAVMPFEDKTGKSYGAIGDLLTQEVISSAMGSSPEFLQFVTRDYIDQLQTEQAAGQSGALDETSAARIGKLLGVHAFVFGKVLMVIENYPPEKNETGQNSVIEKTKQGDRTLSCTYVVHERSGSVKVQGSFQIVEVESGVITSSESIATDAQDAVSWVTYAGEEDAIPHEIRQRNQGERAIATPQDLLSKSITDMGSKLANRLLAAYR